MRVFVFVCLGVCICVSVLFEVVECVMLMVQVPLSDAQLRLFVMLHADEGDA